MSDRRRSSAASTLTRDRSCSHDAAVRLVVAGVIARLAARCIAVHATELETRRWRRGRLEPKERRRRVASLSFGRFVLGLMSAVLVQTLLDRQLVLNVVGDRVRDLAQITIAVLLRVLCASMALWTANALEDAA